MRGICNMSPNLDHFWERKGGLLPTQGWPGVKWSSILTVLGHLTRESFSTEAPLLAHTACFARAFPPTHQLGIPSATCATRVYQVCILLFVWDFVGFSLEYNFSKAHCHLLPSFSTETPSGVIYWVHNKGHISYSALESCSQGPIHFWVALEDKEGLPCLLLLKASGNFRQKQLIPR